MFDHQVSSRKFRFNCEGDFFSVGKIKFFITIFFMGEKNSIENSTVEY